MIKITECPRDAMQGIKEFIPTEKKIKYLNKLLEVGFDKLDFGSFVSPKAVPQMSDTAEVLESLDLSVSNTELLAIIANKRGAEDACKFEEISYLGYPFSISETFQIKNTNAGIEESYSRVEEIQNLALDNNKSLLIYISMAFGNPYEDEWSPELVSHNIEKLAELGITHFALADTVGISDEDNITSLFSKIINNFPDLSISAHLHSNPKTSIKKIEAAYKAGCRNFDTAMKGFGGCPMVEDELVGNIATENLIQFASEKNIDLGLDMNKFSDAMEYAGEVF